MANKKTILNKELDFNFKSETTAIFDNMIKNSIPQYEEIQKLLITLTEKFSTDGDKVLDIGSSLGTTSINLALKLDRKIISLDSSLSMVNHAKEKAIKVNGDFVGSVSFYHLDFIDEFNLDISDSNVCIASLTMQFIRPVYRKKAYLKIYSNLKKGGVLLLVEKTVLTNSNFNRAYIELYHKFKKSKGYSNEDILKKRLSIENILIPYSIEENISILKNVGFVEVQTFFQWLNFVGLIAIK